MEVLKKKKGEIIARKRDKVSEWYIIQEGTVLQKNAFVKSTIQANGIIGILEQDWFMCDYIAQTDVTLIVFPCNSVQEVKNILKSEQKMRRVFLRAALLQRHQLFCVYADLIKKVQRFQTALDEFYSDYKTYCGKYHIDIQNVYDLDHFTPLIMQHKAEAWEMNHSNSVMKEYLDEYLSLYVKDVNLCLGAIMEASAQMHRVTLGIGEMIDFLTYNEEVLISNKPQSLYQLYVSLVVSLYAKEADTSKVKEQIKKILDFGEEIGIYDPEILALRREEFETLESNMRVSEEESDEEISAESDLEYILVYAGYEGKDLKLLQTQFGEYQNYMNASKTDEAAYQSRKQITKLFYEIYERCFLKAVSNELNDNVAIPMTIQLFLNFGYMDVGYVGEEKADALYHIADHIDICRSEHVFTMYDWLKQIYLGVKEPSKNEFDLDYTGTLLEELKQRNITKAEFEEKQKDQEAKLRFELTNMFPSVNRITYGSITSFCPVLNGNDIYSAPENLLVTVAKLHSALDELRTIDFSVFYRPLHDTELKGDMVHEDLMTEILPDVILMPNAGSKAMMWQETASVRNDTPARFMVPIFTTGDLDELLLETVARYRWEICRKIQGVHWNDARDHSLTSDYYDYLQFYRKNRELSSDTKEQIKTALTRAKNSYKEVFVRDYANYIKYEAKGGFRLNKYVRNIMFTYCPLSKSKCEELKSNPMFAEVIAKHENKLAKERKRISNLYEKYVRDVGDITPEMKNHQDFYQM